MADERADPPHWEPPGNELHGIDGAADLTAGPSELPDPARRAVVSLLTNRYVWRDRQKIAWDGVVTYEDEVRGRLDEMYMDLIVDVDAGVAFKRQQDGEDVPKLLRRERALSRDASFVMLLLFREYAYADRADGSVVVTREQISEFLRAFREEGDAHEAGFARRVDAAISALVKPWQLLEPDPDVDYLFRISPVILPLLGVDEMTRLETAYRAEADRAAGSATDRDLQDESGPENEPDSEAESW